MKSAIIIENQPNVDTMILNFLEDFPNLFSDVQEETFCLNRSDEGLLLEILKKDAIIVNSTWMYIDQLRVYVDAFLKKEFPSKELYVGNICSTLNEWLNPEFPFMYRTNTSIAKDIPKLLNKGFKLFDFSDNYDLKRIKDNNPYFGLEKDRFPLKLNEVIFKNNEFIHK